jgi:hypothetical protein
MRICLSIQKETLQTLEILCHLCKSTQVFYNKTSKKCWTQTDLHWNLQNFLRLNNSKHLITSNLSFINQWIKSLINSRCPTMITKFLSCKFTINLAKNQPLLRKRRLKLGFLTDIALKRYGRKKSRKKLWINWIII